MQFNIEKVSELERRLSVTVPVEEIDSAVQKKLQELTKTIKLPGFRHGKVPLQLVKQRYESSARAEVVENTVNSTYREVLEKEQLNPAGSPHFDSFSAKPNEPFSYVASFELYPEIKITDLSQVNVEKIVVEITDQDIEDMLNKLRRMYGTWNEVADQTHAAQEGESVVVDYTVMVDEATHETQQDYRVELGARRTLADFEKPLYASKVGDELNFTLKFPDNYFDKKCAGRDGKFTVKVKKILQLAEAGLNDEFAKKMGEENLDKLRATLHKILADEQLRLTGIKFRQDLIDVLLAKYTVNVPKCLIADEVQKLLKQRDEKAQLTAEQQEELNKVACRKVAGGMLLGAIAKEHKVDISPEQIRARMTDMVSKHENPVEAAKWYFKDKKRIAQLESHVLEEELFKQIEKLITVTEKKMNYNEAVKVLGGALL